MKKIMYLGGVTPDALAAIDISIKSTGGGWVSSFINAIKTEEIYELAYVCFYGGISEMKSVVSSGVRYYILPLLHKKDEKLTAEDVLNLKKAADEFSPDIVHIFGTEREKTYKMLQVVGMDRCIISITGLVSVYDKHYYGGIDSRLLDRLSFNDFIRRIGPRQQRKNFENLGKSEIKALSESRYIFGRTTWDYACTKQINTNVKYFHLDEIMRPIFYKKQWLIDNIERHSIFVSQGTYPLKGLHKMIEAMPQIIAQFPDAHLYVAGINITDNAGFLKKIKRTTYGRYLQRLIKKLGMKEHITFLGMLDEEQMCERHLHSHVFILPSLIENSSNSLGEAMLLGVPSVASCVGGAQDLIQDRETGFLYPFDESYMLAHYITQIFSDDLLAQEISKKARKQALRRYSVNGIVKDAIKAYEQIIEYGENKCSKK